MNKRFIGVIFSLFAAAMLVGCAGLKPSEPLTFTPQKFDAGKYSPKVENFQIIIDASESMDTNMHGEKKYLTAKNFVSALNQSIPDALAYNAGLRSFGHHPKQSEDTTALPYGMTRYTQSGFADGLDSIKYLGGVSPLADALVAAANDLKDASGQSTIVVVSDGISMEDAPAAAAKINAEMGDRLCVYTVQVGDSEEGKKVLGKVAKAFQCGSAYAAADLVAGDAFGKFVETAFLASGKWVDSDGDGVPDHLDKCPDTPKGVQVDADGCPVQFSLRIEFDFDSAEIRSTYHNDLPIAAQFIKNNPAVPYMLLAGHDVASTTVTARLSSRARASPSNRDAPSLAARRNSTRVDAISSKSGRT